MTSRCSLLSPENAPFDEFIFSIKFCEIFQGFIKKFQGFSRVSRDFQGFKNFPGFSRISRARTNPVNKVPPPEVRHLWQFNAKLAEECRMLRVKLAERTEERDELISSIFSMQGMINHYDQMDKMSNVVVGVDTLYKKRKSSNEEEEDSSGSESCSCDGGSDSE